MSLFPLWGAECSKTNQEVKRKTAFAYKLVFTGSFVPQRPYADCRLGRNTAIWDYAWIKQSYPPALSICHHILQSLGYEFGLGLWRQSSAVLANNLQCKMIVFIEEHHRVDRGIRANKPW